MRVGIDGYNLAMPHGTGVATYGFALANALRNLGYQVEGVFGLDVGDDPALREIMFFDQFARDDGAGGRASRPVGKWTRRMQRLRAIGGRLRADEVPQSSLVEREVFATRLPKFDRLTSSPELFDLANWYFQVTGRFLKLKMANPPQIMHWTYPVPVELAGARNVYTLHDLVPLRLPYTTLDVKKNYYRLIKQCIRRADHICTVSESSRQDILSRFTIDPANVTNTYQSSPIAPGSISDDPLEDARMIDGIFGLSHRGYYLFFGAIEPKKNVGRIIEAYLGTHSEHALVIVGARAWQSEGELRLLTNGGYGKMARQVIRLEYLPRALLLRLIRGARAVVFPSLFEGFGLPVLETMQLGTPVITSNTSSLPEVAGNAAKLVDPYSVADISEAWRAIDRDQSLREDLAHRGLEQAARYSDREYRARIAAMYDRVLAGGAAQTPDSTR
jgi:glycosyltransferase involved in cell wall biosynthesis